MSQSVVVNPRPALKAKLTKEPFSIPNLKPYYKAWPTAVNPNYPGLKVALEARIKNLYPPKKAAKLIQDDYALLSSMWWPRATADRLQTCTFWFLWLFTWDDEIDQSTSDLFIHIHKANDFRKESLEYVKFCLGVGDDETAKWDFQNNPPNRPLIRSLDVIGAHLQKVYNHDQIMTFVNEIDYYMGCQQREQKRKLTRRLPIVAEYLETRMGTSAVTSMLALNEFADGNDIPRGIMIDPKMISLWYEVILNMSLSNDLLSLRKEIKHGDIDSMVPVLVSARGLTVRQAVKETEAEINRNIERFDQIADALLEEIKLTHPEKVDEVASYIVGCRYNQMANFLWSLTTTRYGLGDVVRDAEGRIPIVIENVN
ncbi:cyclase [Aspergillus flavus AF70]|nr:cyclase [Aspergillus flavus AF70]